MASTTQFSRHLASVLLPVTLVLTLNGCGQSNGPYVLNKPTNKYTVGKGLKEISGLAWYKKDHFATIQDEDGEIYIYDLSKQDVIEKIKFTKDGDYEDIAIVGKKVFVLRSDGTLFKVKDLGDKDQETKKYKTHLDDGNDTEGLCYDENNKRLLILCKEDPGKKMKGERAIYAWDIAKKELSKKPVIRIKESEVRHHLESKGVKVKRFKPSGLDVHPITGEIYVIASVGKALVILSGTGEVQEAFPLNEKLFEQPEGICIMENGDLLISNEGKKKKGNILKFEYLLGQ